MRASSSSRPTFSSPTRRSSSTPRSTACGSTASGSSRRCPTPTGASSSRWSRCTSRRTRATVRLALPLLARSLKPPLADVSLNDARSPQLGLPPLPRLVDPVDRLALVFLLVALPPSTTHQAPPAADDVVRARLHDAQDLGQLQQLQRVALPHQAAAEAVGRARVGGRRAGAARQGGRGCVALPLARSFT